MIFDEKEALLFLHRLLMSGFEEGEAVAMTEELYHCVYALHTDGVRRMHPQTRPVPAHEEAMWARLYCCRRTFQMRVRPVGRAALTDGRDDDAR